MEDEDSRRNHEALRAEGGGVLGVTGGKNEVVERRRALEGNLRKGARGRSSSREPEPRAASRNHLVTEGLHAERGPNAPMPESVIASILQSGKVLT